MLQAALLLTSLTLTATMFATKQAMLGFACVIFWAINGAQAFIQSTVPWGDIYFYLFFASFGMAIFCMLAAFGLREKRDTILDIEADEEVGTGEGEGADNEGSYVGEESSGPPVSKRTTAVRKRAEKRREVHKKKPWGPFE